MKFWRAAVLGLGLVALVPPAGQALAAQQSEHLSVELTLDSRTVTLWLRNPAPPVGALEVSVVGIGPLSGPCELNRGMGACSVIDGVLRLVAINPTGWEEDALLLEVELVDDADPESVALTVEQITDLDGGNLVAAVNQLVTPPAAPESSGSRSALTTVGVAVATAGVLGATLLAMRRSSSRRS